ncbi:MAG: putative sulfate exporter family transporter [Actinomycetota bacterium]|nr:putative sulfate exporter family transporter [Actinomycetota bacterium]
MASTSPLPRRLTIAERLQAPGAGILPGVALAAVVGLAAHLLAKLVFPHALAVGLEVPLAMILGLLLVNFTPVPESAAKGIRFAVKYVLGVGIVLLGLRLNLQSVAVIGADALGLVLLTIGGTCAFALLVGPRLGVRPRVALLIGVGTAVCGASAIAAAAPVVKADDREVSFAIGTITIFGTLAVLVYPFIGHALGLDVLTFGLWAGSAVPDTAQTVASGAVYSTVGRDVAAIVKLVRNVLIVPLLLLIAWGWNRYGEGASSAETTRKSIRKAFPIFLVGFLALAFVRTMRLVDPEVVADVDVVTRACFVVTLAGFGLQTRLAQFRSVGVKPFLLGFGTAGLLGITSLTIITTLGLGPARTEVAAAVDPRPLGQWAPVCVDEEPAAFAGAFVVLSRRLGDRMGEPLSCARVDGNGDTVQETSRGTARLADGRVTFSDGRDTWRGLIPASASSEPVVSGVRLKGRVIATGIPGAGAISPVGTFHPGGPMHDKREFAATTQPGEMLDPARLLVASTSNFGARLARRDWAPGSVLSLATDAPAPLEVPADFAANGEQAAVAGGDVQLYTAQSPAFLNRIPNEEADTADMPGVSNPLGISINNAFGRPWFAGATGGSDAGIESVLDPNGRPLSEAPSKRAGGVFAGVLTSRDPQLVRGALDTGAVANAFLGASPDTSGRAVFAVATADGAIVQVHVEHGVDGLAPAGTIAPTGGGRVGMLFNWVPDRFLYLTDPGNDAVVQLRLDDDFEVFHLEETRRVESPHLAGPVDLAPAVPEVANPGFASNTTLAGGADFYVANRGSGTIVRVRQDGAVIAVARVTVPGAGTVGPDRINGIAVSPDADTIYVTLDGQWPGRPELDGAVVALDAFGAPE